MQTDIKIQKLEKRVKYLEETLLKLIGYIDQEKDYQAVYNLLWHEFYEEINYER